MNVRSLLVPLLLAMACGAEPRDDELAPPEPNECDPNALWPTCVPDCGEEGYDSANPICVEGVWECPSDTTVLEECPENSCRRNSGLCCDTSIGVTNRIGCDDGARLACPSPLRPMDFDDGCMPESVTDCNDLYGTACSSSELECHNPGRCNTNCTCDPPSGGGALMWQCATLLC